MIKYLCVCGGGGGGGDYFILNKKKEMFYFQCTQHILFMVIWRHTYGKGPLYSFRLAAMVLFICIIPQTE